MEQLVYKEEKRPVLLGNIAFSPLQGEESIKKDSQNSVLILDWKNGLFNDENRPLIEKVRSTRKTQVYKVAGTNKISFIYKIHADEGNFLKEYQALLLLGETGLVPQLLEVNEEKLILVTECLQQKKIMSMKDTGLVAFHLGKVHASCFLKNRSFFKRNYGHCSLSEISNHSNHSNTINQQVDQRAISEAMKLAISLYGKDYIPCSLGDLKIDHIFSREVIDEPIVFVDLETFSVGGIEQIDLLSLLNIKNDDLQPFGLEAWEYLIEFYLMGRGEVGIDKKIRINTELLALIAEGFDLHFLLPMREHKFAKL